VQGVPRAVLRPEARSRTPASRTGTGDRARRSPWHCRYLRSGCRSSRRS
jgi:hypothetical protein